MSASLKLPPAVRAALAEACTRIGNEVAGTDGFVAIQPLLARFGAQLHVRPLLVEAMLATTSQHRADGSTTTGWAVLVDQEKHPIGAKELTEERRGKPLPVRFRNTVAHELVHALGFRSKEFGVDLALGDLSLDERPELVAAIERDVERLSPLLLWPEIALQESLRLAISTLSVDDVADTCRAQGISRQVLISRLNLLPATDIARNRVALLNVAIGIGEWQPNGSATLRSWPLFINFRHNIAPEFLWNLRGQDRAPVGSILPADGFPTVGGQANVRTAELPAGAFGATRFALAPFEIAIERTGGKPGSSFLFLVRGLRNTPVSGHSPN